MSRWSVLVRFDPAHYVHCETVEVIAEDRDDALVKAAEVRVHKGWPAGCRFRPRLIDDLSYAPGPLIRLLREADHMPEGQQ
jgi:hypothetical protein